MTDIRKMSKVCGVCGDKALGFNFSAITCESCKAFFRRNALKRKEFKCPFNENCKVDIITRRFCQKCRLKKCFEIGMKKEWIMSEEEKQSKRAKIEKNKSKKKLSRRTYKLHNPNNGASREKSLSSPLSPICVSNDKYNCKLQLSSLQQSKELTETKNILFNNSSSHLTSIKSEVINNSHISVPSNNSSDIEVKSDNSNLKIHEDNFSISSDSTDTSSCVSKNTSDEKKFFEISHIKPEIMCRISNEITDMSVEFESQSSFSGSHQIVTSLLSEKDDIYLPCSSQTNRSLHLSRSETNTKALGELETNKLQELVMANEILKMPLSCWVPDPNLLDVINMTDLAIRRLIKMSTRISGFKILCQDDQIALLKGGCTELMILRSVMLYDPEKECWKGPGGPKVSIKMDILKEAKGNLYEEHKKFINSFHPSWRNDENIMLLLSAITLFSPHRPCTIHKDVIQMEQEIYYYLLQKYLNTIYSENEANSIYIKLMDILKDLHILNEENVKVYLDVNPKDVEPLLIEIFDLKH
ncbi:nuclear hormone receptor HR96-like [Centruroides vittatus]|uniref:nuclear hormone receptor HR96-like n=1 Tax=Centruroides vittatus TaxID=120091 RepID=UPI0035109C3C